jgi:hypothetical protein
VQQLWFICLSLPDITDLQAGEHIILPDMHYKWENKYPFQTLQAEEQISNLLFLPIKLTQ